MIIVNEYSGLVNYALSSLHEACCKTYVATNVYKNISQLFRVDIEALSSEKVYELFEKATKLINGYF